MAKTRTLKMAEAIKEELVEMFASRFRFDPITDEGIIRFYTPAPISTDTFYKEVSDICEKHQCFAWGLAPTSKGYEFFATPSQ